MKIEELKEFFNIIRKELADLKSENLKLEEENHCYIYYQSLDKDRIAELKAENRELKEEITKFKNNTDLHYEIQRLQKQLYLANGKVSSYCSHSHTTDTEIKKLRDALEEKQPQISRQLDNIIHGKEIELSNLPKRFVTADVSTCGFHKWVQYDTATGEMHFLNYVDSRSFRDINHGLWDTAVSEHHDE